MKFSVLAIDFDGTVAIDDMLDETARSAIAELRSKNITVILATGRTLEDLRRIAGDLHFVDAVVAENGAVVLFPDSGHLTVNAEPPPQGLLNELRGEGIRHSRGSVVVEADADDAARILAIIRRLELPLVIAFNRGRLMVLPQTISKATGVRQALTILRLSPHNAVAIGDAENDHELLRLSEVGVAVAWGSPALRAAADYVLPGSGPAAVASYIRDLVTSPHLPIPKQTRRHLLLGHGDDGRPLTLGIRGRNILVAGDPKSGKSWITGLLCEQLILYGYSLCVLDPEGDYVSLESLPGVAVFGGAGSLPRPKELLRALRHADVSIVIDLSHANHSEKVEYIRTTLESVARLRRHSGVPHRIVLDEAHLFLHEDSHDALIDQELNGYTLVSYRASRLSSRVLETSQAIVVTRESDPAEVRALFAMCHKCQGGQAESDWERILGSLTIGEAAVLPLTDEACGEIRKIRLSPRLTRHVRHLAKYIDIPVPDRRAFLFRGPGSVANQRASTLREFVRIVEGAPAGALDGHLRHSDFSRWISDVFGDYTLAKALGTIEHTYVTSGVEGVATELARAVRARYEFLEPVPQTASLRV